MRPISLAAALTLTLAAPAAADKERDPWKALDGNTLVYVANGSGGEETATEGLTVAARQSGALLFIKTIHWSRFHDSLRDHNDHAGQLAAAERTAMEVQLVRQKCPKAKIVLMGHSSGTRVILATAEQLPAKSVERIFLFAPSVNAFYDVRPALKASRRGIDSYTSPHDLVLDIASGLLGTADGYRTAAAGEVGFQLPRNPALTKEFEGLRQHYWNDRFHNVHNWGGHFSWVRPRFLREHVVPLLMITETAAKDSAK
jgi:pimeloyl-ACP methyl ester carboxylesterase